MPIRSGFRGGSVPRAPFSGKNLVDYTGNNWSMAGVGPLLGSQLAPSYENFWICHCQLSSLWFDSARFEHTFFCTLGKHETSH